MAESTSFSPFEAGIIAPKLTTPVVAGFGRWNAPRLVEFSFSSSVLNVCILGGLSGECLHNLAYVMDCNGFVVLLWRFQRSFKSLLPRPIRPLSCRPWSGSQEGRPFNTGDPCGNAHCQVKRTDIL